MNIDNAVDKAYEGKSFKEIAAAPISAIQVCRHIAPLETRH